MKRIIVFLILAVIFSLPACAQESTYENMYSASGIEKIEDLLPKDAQKTLEESGISAKNPDWYENNTPQSVFSSVFGMMKSGFEKPIKNMAVTLALILLAALASSFSKDEKSGEIFGYFFAAVISAQLLQNVFYAVNTSVNAIKGSATFMFGAVPVFTGVAVMSGTPAAAAASSSLILLAVQTVSGLCAFVIVPLMSAYMAVGVASAVSPLAGSGIPESLKKIANWIMGLISALFLGLLSVQTSVASAADGMKMKTAKFLVGSLVPAVGSALSEAVSTVSSSVGLLKNTVGIYAVFGVCVLLLPVVLELAAWRLTLWVLRIMSTAFSVKKVDAVIGSIDSVLAVLMGITAFIGAVFVISLGIAVGK